MPSLYHLTSPPMHGPGVKKLQVLLKKYHPGAVDGHYGPATAGAVKRAKFALGYPLREINTQAGSALVAYLSGTKKLPVAYKLRAKRRAAGQPARQTRREKAYKLAVSQIGQTEHPAGSNKSKFSAWYGLTGPWCAMFCTWCYVGAGSKALVKGERFAYVPYVLAAAQSHKYGLSVTTEPVKGDLVLFDWGGDGTPDHIGLFGEWTSKKAGTFKSVEGNTGVGNDSNGGEVMRRDRNRANVRAFVRVSA
jgi:peptidoglycan hydrolase-like protein with peptidoglycan-binding domain